MQNNMAPIVTSSRPRGKVTLVLSIIFGVLVFALGGVCIWLGLNYIEQRDNVDSIASTRVAEAVKEQTDKLEAEFAEREKQPFVQFTGPEDYGRLVFNYPKTWSLYIEKDDLPYRAYVRPKFVQATSGRYALRILIQDDKYENVVAAYNNLVKKGLSSSTIDVNGTLGTRFDGELSRGIVGSVVIFKIRDKTVSLQTDADIFRPDFDQILKSITFNK